MKNESVYNFKERSLIYALALGVGIFSSLIMIAFLAIITIFLDLGEASSGVFATISIAFGCFIAAFLSSKKLRKGGIVNGIICAITTFLLLFFVALIVDKGGVTFSTFFNFITAFLSGLIGGIMGVGQKRYSAFR